MSAAQSNANAGHTPPIFVRTDSAEELTDTDLLLGVVTQAVYIKRTVQLEPGDALVLFTDGVKSGDKVRFGKNGLLVLMVQSVNSIPS